MKSFAFTKSKNTERICWSKGIPGSLCGYGKATLGAQEHRREMRIGDADLLKHDTMTNQRTPKGSGDQMAFLGLLRLF